MRSNAPRHPASARSQPQIAAVHERDPVLVDIRKAHQAAFLHGRSVFAAHEARAHHNYQGNPCPVTNHLRFPPCRVPRGGRKPIHLNETCDFNRIMRQNSAADNSENKRVHRVGRMRNAKESHLRNRIDLVAYNAGSPIASVGTKMGQTD